MRATLPVLFAASLLVACGKKSAPAPAAEPAPAPVVAAEPAPEAETEPAEPEGPPPIVPNADFQAAITHADGSTVTGHVIRVERGEDRFAEKGWTDRASKLTLSLERGEDLVDVSWDEINTITLRYGSRADIDCQYESTYTPWMYMCVLKATPAAVTTDGVRHQVTTLHKWKFIFEDGNEEQFYVYKLPAREQDTHSAGLDDNENYDLYGKLQTQVLQIAKTSAVTKIVISK